MSIESNNWEELRRQARQLENEIDLKLVSFSKLGTSYGSQEYRNENSDTVPLLSSTNSDHMFETMALEIEQLLSKLTDVNDKMISYCQTQAVTGSTVAHTLQRHRDILQDCTHEFQKTKANIQARKEREQLLSSVRKDIDAYKSSSGLNRRTDLYLKEHDHLRNSEKMVDDQISIAVKTKEELLNQRIAMKAIQTKMTTLVSILLIPTIHYFLF
ncbi:Golgi SNAP receptor complex member 1 [Araneus ventricosus]|uniref:Golgi SNAP receptor complex member 1 n=1 Tax=Araneus ventricosus TaxID=182803 RepID=A0A4Y2TP15_ARAVE|nr:Golgi SNAP receptor complex member 1 [Araneus ventricosus]